MVRIRLLVTCNLAFMCFCVTSTQQNDWIDGNRLKNVFNNLAEESMGRSRFKDHLNKYIFHKPKLNGTVILEELSSKIEERMKNVLNAVERLAQEVKRGYNESLYGKRGKIDDKQCCNIDSNDVIYDDEFLRQINTKQTCMRFSEDAASESIIPDSEAIYNVMTDNKGAETSIKTQYYGTEEGVFVRFPAVIDSMCHVYDPRYRPWYAEAATSRPKDIVVVFDRSGKNNLLSVVQEATKTVIATLNADDRVGLVAFNDKAYPPPGKDGNTCYYSSLAAATPDNKDYLTSWIDTLSSEGSSVYKPALTAAFDFLEKAPKVLNDPRERHSVIIFLSDGEQSYGTGLSNAQEILNLIRDRNAKLANKVVITTYEIINDDFESTGLLRNMSLQTQADTSKGEITPGEYARISSTDNVRSKIGSYHNTLDKSTEDDGKPVQTTPYVDFSGLGLVMSVCLPVYVSGRLKGVACIDVSLSEMASDIIKLHNGNNAYGFMTDYKSRTIIHPLMPDALNYNKQLYLNIIDLERNTEVGQVLEDMKNGTSGSKKILTEFIKSRGNTTTDGIATYNALATYTWKAVGRLRLAVVTTDDDVSLDVTMRTRGVIASENFIYHRIDLKDDLKKCEYFGRMCTTQHSVVKLTEKAFFAGKLLVDNKERIDRYRVYLNDKTKEYNHESITQIAKKTIAVSEGLDGIWKTLTDYDDTVVSRYYGDYYGHVRIFPGLAIPRSYDMTQRPFFRKTVYSKADILTVTPPYLDAIGAGIVASLCAPVFFPSGGTTGDRDILGILGLDFKMSYMESVIKQEFKACTAVENRCFIVDTSGYLVYHSDINYSDQNEEKEYDGYHITEKEADISKFLISKKYMLQKDCIDFGYKKNLFTWRIEVDTAIERYNSEPYFDMLPVSGTNLYLGIKKRSQPSTTCYCADRADPSYGVGFFTCRNNANAMDCSCPCVKDANYDYCQNHFQLGVNGSPTCYPQPPSVVFVSPIANESSKVVGLPRCFPNKCHDNGQAESSCGRMKQCKWCPKVQRCVDKEKDCPPIIAIDQVELVAIIVGCVVPGVVLIVVIAAVLSVMWRKGKLICCGARMPQAGVYQPEPSEFSRSDLRVGDVVWNDPGNGHAVEVSGISPSIDHGGVRYNK